MSQSARKLGAVVRVSRQQIGSVSIDGDEAANGRGVCLYVAAIVSDATGMR